VCVCRGFIVVMGRKRKMCVCVCHGLMQCIDRMDDTSVPCSVCWMGKETHKGVP
jgi:hypothetical protein